MTNPTNYPTYDSDGIAIPVRIMPQNIIAWFALDWQKWCANGSRDIVAEKNEVENWYYQGASTDTDFRKEAEQFVDALITKDDLNPVWVAIVKNRAEHWLRSFASRLQPQSLLSGEVPDLHREAQKMFDICTDKNCLYSHIEAALRSLYTRARSDERKSIKDRLFTRSNINDLSPDDEEGAVFGRLTIERAIDNE